MGGHHQACLGFVALDRCEHCLRVELVEHRDRRADGQDSKAIERARVIHRADNEMCRELGEPVGAQPYEVLLNRVASGEHCGRQVDPFGLTGRAAGVHQVWQRTHVARWFCGRRPSHPLGPRDHIGVRFASPSDDGADTGRIRRGDTALEILGADKQNRRV